MKNKILLILILAAGAISLSATRSFAAERIVFVRLTDGYWQLWTASLEGVEAKQMTFSTYDKRDPVWMDHGKIVAYRTNNGELFVVDLKTLKEKKILEKYTFINDPDYSDILNMFVFVRYDPRLTDISDIWLSDIEGAKTKLLTKDKRLKYQPRFSNDGTKIAYVKADETNQNHQLWLADNDGENLIQLTHANGFDTLPRFSPDGRKIVFTSNREDNDYEIYLLDIKTKQVSRLTSSKGLDTHACFSPDGSQIVFVSNRTGRRQLWVMDADGTNKRVLTEGDDESADPVWIGLEKEN